VPLKYDSAARSFSEGLAMVRQNGKYGFIALTGNSPQPAPTKSVKAEPSAANAVRKREREDF